MIKFVHFSLACALLAPGMTAQGLKGFKFEIETLGGQKLDQDDFKKNVVLLDFWGTWCGPCRKAVPGLVDLYKKYKHHGLEIIGLNYRERGSADEIKATVRSFAEENGITYTLAIGTPEIQKQVIGFSGYPTMLFFKKGMKYDHLEVGFTPDHLTKMEKWIRTELGLEKAAAEGAEGAEESEEEEPVAPAAKAKVPDGVIYRPGNHDTGFEFDEKGTDGKKIKFKDYLGKKVVLVFTSTWDHEAVGTAAIVNELHDTYSSKGVVVIAASLEIKKDWESRVKAIDAFAKTNKTKYPILPVGISFLKKVFEPSGIPFYLVFDEKGTLILRRKNNAKKALFKAISQVLEAS